MKIVTVVGARPQFIKAAAISRVIRRDYVKKIDEVLVHTGQHYDENMSKVFFDELSIPIPKYNLEISGGQHGAMTGRMLESIEEVLLKERPDWLLIYGDTNSTLAGALAAAKLHIPVAHVEAGLRSFNMRMPEEVNRILADRVSSRLFCPTQTAIDNLKSEGVTRGVSLVGDVMYDVALFYKEKAKQKSAILSKFRLEKKSFCLATCHRAENTDNPAKLGEILSALTEISKTLPIVFPLHPRTRKLISEYGLDHYLASLIVVEPLAFLDMVTLEQSAKIIITDSGGVQKEAFFYRIPCVTMREETEWTETVDLGWNILTGTERESIIRAALTEHKPILDSGYPYGSGNASEAIIAELIG